MAYEVKTNRAIARRIDMIRKAGGNLRQAWGQAGQYLLREARRRAPRGQSHRGTGLAASLNIGQPNDLTLVLQSDKPYAAIQNRGGVITPGTGRLAARMLIVPVSEAGKALLNSLGSGTSLRSVPGLFVFKNKRNGKVFLARHVAGGAAAKRVKRRGKDGGVKRAVSTGKGALGMEILFRLIPRATLKPNPAPRGYAPSLGEPDVLAGVKRIVDRNIRQAGD